MPDKQAPQIAEMSEEELLLAIEEEKEAIRKAEEAAAARVAILGSKLQREIDERVGLRSDIEGRWLRALRQINGKYEANVLPPEEEYGSRIYVPLTRRLRNMAEARIVDILFPAGDQRFYTLDPSPVADIAEALQAMDDEPPDAPVPGMPGVQMADMRAELKDSKKEAELRATRLERVIDDRLVEARFASKARRVIGDAIDFGTGVLKGPVPKRVKRRVRVNQNGVMVTQVKMEIVQTYEWVPVWHWFPDMSAMDVQECESIFEAHPLTKSELLALKEQPGFLPAAIDQLASGGPAISDDKTRRKDRQQIAGLGGVKDDRFNVWEAHCTISGADIKALYPDDFGAQDQEGSGEQEIDDDAEVHAVVWFCNGIVIKAIERPLDSDQRHVYSVLYWQRDKSGIFGYGLPEEIMDQQDSTNSMYRALHDAIGWAAGPISVVDEDLLEPYDRSYNLYPLKRFRKKDPTIPAANGIAIIQVDTRIQELGALFDKSKQLMEEIATAPQIAAGTEAPAYQQSATQASILYQASTLWVRRVVRHWDDDMVEPTVARAVEWEMEFNPDDSIKGDYKPVTKGVAALIELEGMGSRMQTFVQLLGQMEIPPRDQYRIARQFARSLKLDPDDMLPSEEELKQLKGAEQAPDLETKKLEVAQENNQMDHAAKMRELDVKEADLGMRGEEYARRERLALLELASRERMTVEQAAQKYGYDWNKLQAELADNERQRQHETQVFNAETAVKMRTGSGL